MPAPGDKSDFIEERYKSRDEPETAHCEIRETLAVRINYKIKWRVFTSGRLEELLNAFIFGYNVMKRTECFVSL